MAFLFLRLVFSFCTPLASGAGVASPDFVQPECLEVSASEFVGSVRGVLDVLQKVISILSKLGSSFGDFRVSNAISDCLDLLDLSSDELSWTASATQNPTGKHNTTGKLSSDLRTWLSAALANPETCMEGFEGAPNCRQSSHKKGQFPSWVKPGDRKLLQANVVAVDVVVAADGTGNFTKVMDAVLAAPDYSMKRYVIYIKRGVYKENVEIKKKKWNLMMIGDGMDATVISAVSGRGFIARDLSFQNTAGPEKHQAVALRSDSDLSVFYRCGFFGYQGTLYTRPMRQFYRECKISGTVDFIYGDSTALFQNCKILVRKGLPNQKNIITAQGRKHPNDPTGFSIQFCNITADSDLLPSVNTTQTYLGRPWKEFSRTVIMQSYLSNVLRPEGWIEWNGPFALDTLYYAEYMNYGPGAGLADRIKWPGYHVLNSSSEANNFTVARFIEGNLWLPSTGVIFTAGLEI
ncbi:hypothetical protein L6164_011871 [Bauhinia variegata]|uniref:Uncharacterized protein n=1 Tax=Bauhinia variegata TaxID=167791 RepID=A0ACB9P9H5_BAUVA|nr:hypothetical protein L6164_011871 [Bauhinia variegata]